MTLEPTTELSAKLTNLERAELQAQEKKISEGISQFFETGHALFVIREQRLYRETHKSFEDYCQDKWDISDRHANRLIDSAKVVLNLRDKSPSVPKNERQARELSGLTPEQQTQAWEETIAEGKKDGGKPTTGILKRVAAKFRGKKAKPAPKRDGWTKEELAKDEELDAAFGKIAKLYGKADTEAMQHGAIPGLKRSEVLLVAKLPPEKAIAIQNLMFVNLWGPQRALNHVNDMPTEKSTLHDMQNWCLGTKGLYFNATINGFEHSVKATRALTRAK